MPQQYVHVSGRHCSKRLQAGNPYKHNQPHTRNGSAPPPRHCPAARGGPAARWQRTAGEQDEQQTWHAGQSGKRMRGHTGSRRSSRQNATAAACQQPAHQLRQLGVLLHANHFACSGRCSMTKLQECSHGSNHVAQLLCQCCQTTQQETSPSLQMRLLPTAHPHRRPSVPWQQPSSRCLQRHQEQAVGLLPKSKRAPPGPTPQAWQQWQQQQKCLCKAHWQQQQQRSCRRCDSGSHQPRVQQQCTHGGRGRAGKQT